eukprot:TRINITY_DN10013_c0_g2_i2.p1 TRINITY_DN10013_c0_g2~~TRINITY_DN10013_c0_g2_i2.p1  ORF type:complete len:385 (-),score=44.77 TRINITY_DN10013_c0_g2_i2:6-1160(-)
MEAPPPTEEVDTNDDLQISPEMPARTLIGGEMVIEVAIYNATDSSVPAGRLRAQVSTRRTGEASVPEIAPDQEVNVVVVIPASGSKDVKDLQDQIRYTFHRSYYCQKIPMVVFAGKLSGYNPRNEDVPHYNILLFGLAGAAKSSFVNSATTCLSETSKVVHCAAVGGSSSHVSSKLARYILPGVKVALWDTWGLTMNTYQDGIMSCILEGQLPSNWDMTMTYDANNNVLEQHQSSRDSRIPHAVLFFITHSALDAQDQTEMIARNYRTVQHLTPLVLITKVDEVDSDIRDHPLDPSPTCHAIRRKAADVLKTSIQHVHLLVNYQSEHHKNFEIDRGIYKILELVVGYAVRNYHQASSRPSPVSSPSAKPTPAPKRPATAPTLHF